MRNYKSRPPVKGQIDGHVLYLVVKTRQRTQQDISSTVAEGKAWAETKHPSKTCRILDIPMILKLGFQESYAVTKKQHQFASDIVGEEMLPGETSPCAILVSKFNAHTNRIVIGRTFLGRSLLDKKKTEGNA